MVHLRSYPLLFASAICALAPSLLAQSIKSLPRDTAERVTGVVTGQVNGSIQQVANIPQNTANSALGQVNGAVQQVTNIPQNIINSVLGQVNGAVQQGTNMPGQVVNQVTGQVINQVTGQVSGSVNGVIGSTVGSVANQIFNTGGTASAGNLPLGTASAGNLPLGNASAGGSGIPSFSDPSTILSSLGLGGNSGLSLGGLMGGFGYPVHDATGNAALGAIKSLSSDQVQLLARILGENRSQLLSLMAINEVLGSARPPNSGSLGTIQPAATSSLADVSTNYGVPANQAYGQTLYGNFAQSLSRIFPTNGFLDVFMGMQPQEYRTAFTNPASFASNAIMSRLTGGAGAQTGQTQSPAALIFGARMATLTPEQRADNQAQVVNDVGAVMTAQTLQNVEDNADKAQTFSAMIASLNKRNDEAATIVEKIAIGNEIAALQAQLAIDQSRTGAVNSAGIAANTQSQTEILTREEKVNQIRAAVGKQ